ncbi:MAG TPA: hypothetical protein VFT64_12565 [Rickettsiales bacterium]|nr:hypothetical protein [Rickettsiales bacterium]
MANSIYIPNEQKEPGKSKAERKSWTGAAWGTFIGSFVSSMAIFVAGMAKALSEGIGSLDRNTLNKMVSFQMMGTLAGTTIGYFTGNKRGQKIDERENATGMHEVKSPSLFNWRAAQGYTLGTMSSSVINAISYATNHQNRSIQKAAQWAGTGLSIGGTVLGAIKGKQEMQQEYNKALAAKQSESALFLAGAQPQTEQSSQKAELPQTGSKQFTKAEDERRTASVDLQTGTATPTRH